MRPIVSFSRSQQYKKEVYVKNCNWTSNRVFFRLCGGSWWRSGNDGNCHTLLLGTLGRWVVASFNWRKNAYYIVLLFYILYVAIFFSINAHKFTGEIIGQKREFAQNWYGILPQLLAHSGQSFGYAKIFRQACTLKVGLRNLPFENEMST